jgi:ABC-type transporter Mla maintaining outer membrane lipid asymmetry permease subunit MlaE
MVKRVLGLVIISAFLFFTSGCAALIGAALSAAAAYGISRAIDK